MLKVLDTTTETAALSDDPRPKPPKLLDTRQEAAIVALVCGPPPDGYARWTVRVTTEETKRRGIVADVGRETVRQVLAHHELKPWRKKMWCVPTLDAEYIEHMEDVLNVLARPYDALNHRILWKPKSRCWPQEDSAGDHQCRG